MDETSFTDHPHIKRANKASSADIQSFVPSTQTVKNNQYRILACRSSELPESIKTRIWSIFESNMKTIYEGSNSFSWDPPEKRKEMFHKHARFLLVTPGSTIEDIGVLSAEDIPAYCIFRFERDEGRNVIYVYELQTSEKGRRLGLGRALVENLNSIGNGFGMCAIMLTHHKVNDGAKTFYDSLNFKIDETSPYFEDGWVDEDEGESESDESYSILSRKIITSSRESAGP